MDNPNYFYWGFCSEAEPKRLEIRSERAGSFISLHYVGRVGGIAPRTGGPRFNRTNRQAIRVAKGPHVGQLVSHFRQL
ncbi:hypothetical protein GBA52_006058 [Prunus armeniaca]|nr:hypothetical protein GBA52_006058 [Prunus armeniaca]